MKIKHKGLRLLYEKDDRSKLNPNFVPKIRSTLHTLETAENPADMNAPGYRLHSLGGDRKGQWSVRVSGNWRIVFRFKDGEAVDVDLIDYH